MDKNKNTKPLNKNYIARLLKYMIKYKVKISFTLIFMFISSGCTMLIPFLLQQIIDVHIENNDEKGLFITSAIMLASVIVLYFANRIKIKFAGEVGQKAIRDLRVDLFNHVEELSFRYYDSNAAGGIIVRIVNDVNQLSNLFTNSIINVITEMTMLVLATIIMFILNYKLSLLTFSILPIFMILIFIIKNKVMRNWRSVRIVVSDMNSYIHESIVGMKVIQAYSRQKQNRNTFKKVIKNVHESWVKAVTLGSAFAPMIYVISIIGTIIIYGFGSRYLKMGVISIGVLVAFTSYLGRFMQPVLVLSNVYNELLVAMSSCERIFKLMDTKIEIREIENALPLKNGKGNIRFENVVFAYDEKKTVLNNVSFEIEKGKTVAIVGPTGSGKSTIISLLARFYDPLSGKIYINDQNIADVTMKSLRDQIGIMLQEPFIFSGTVMENLTYGNPDAKFYDIYNIAKDLGAHDFIVDLEEGYDTILHERGSKLSIGQKQLIAFVRVMLANPEILILDEATSSIDTHTEMLLQNAIETILQRRTSFVIAHRLSTIRNADIIMVIEDGEIIEMGNHVELLELGGKYNTLYESQYTFLEETNNVHT